MRWVALGACVAGVSTRWVIVGAIVAGVSMRRVAVGGTVAGVSTRIVAVRGCVGGVSMRAVAVRVAAGRTVLVAVREDVRVGSTRRVGVLRGTVGVRVGVTVRVGGGGGLTMMNRAPDSAAGPGFATVIVTEPGAVALPTAVSRVESLKVVSSGTPFHRTCAPGTNWLPSMRSVNGPTAIE